jgi:hypothetical protein
MATGAVWLTGGQIIATNSSTDVIGQLTVSNGTLQAMSLTLGAYSGSSGLLSVAGGAAVIQSNVVVGDCATNLTGQITISGGALYVTNATHTGYLDLRNGTLTVTGNGLLQVDTLVMTNTCGRLVPNGGTLIVGNLVLDSNLSAVGDGIPNGWKEQYGLNPLDSTLAGKDLDGSGFTVLQDYLAGVDPTNPAAAFRISSVVQTGNNLLVTWMMGSGRTNALQATTGSVGGYSTNNFTDIFTVTNTIGTTTNYLDTGAATNVPARYYRVRLVP